MADGGSNDDGVGCGRNRMWTNGKKHLMTLLTNVVVVAAAGIVTRHKFS